MTNITQTKSQTAEILASQGIVLTEHERGKIEIADFGLGRFDEIGLALITYINTERVCAKDLVLLPGQTCPEHKHPPVNGADGKEETFRCRSGVVYLFVEGEPTPSPTGSVPAFHAETYTCRHEIVLHLGEQYTIYPNTLHWFQGGPSGAIVSEFSTKSTDECDIFTDPEIRRTA